jgi:hypothetical protein
LLLSQKEGFEHIRIPGVGIGTGKMEYDIAARQAFEATESVINPRPHPKDWRESSKYRKYLQGKIE